MQCERRARSVTNAVRASIEADREHGAVVAPIYLSSTFTFTGYDQKRPYDYTRTGNPTRDALAGALTELEHGAGTVVTSSGMAAVNLALQLLGPGDTVVAPHDCYGGTYRLLNAHARRGVFDVHFADLTDPVELRQALARDVRMVWVETPSNPLLRITDLTEVCRLARERGALLVVDNTFLSPALQTPILFGADLVVHSTTKYLNGHSDVVGGAVVSATSAMHEEIAWWANCLGITGAPFDSYLTLRGVRTLHARMDVHLRNAAALAELLDSHPAVRRVFYPGLPHHRGHEIAAAQQSGFGGMLSFELQGGVPQVQEFLSGLRYISLAESLGGVESLIAHPATMTHASMDPEARRRAGIGDALLRLSVGIEAADDLLEDVRAGLSRVLVSLEHEPIAQPAVA